MLPDGLGHEARHLADPGRVERMVARFKPHILKPVSMDLVESMIEQLFPKP